MRSKKLIDNKGLSLVELLIAVTILAIIVVPLLHAFISSARVNRKSKQTQKLTTMAQDIMEGLKAYSVEDLAYEFDYPTVSSCNAHPSGFQLVKPSLVGANSAEVASRIKELIYDPTNNRYEKATSTTQSITVTGAGPSTQYKFDKSASKDKIFYFAITNVSSEEATSNSYKADILIKVDPIKYKDPSAGGSVSNNSAQHNDKTLADLSSMDTTRDAFFLESGTQINNAYNKLISKGATISSAEDIYKQIDVDISNDGFGNKKVTYKFTYAAPGVALTDPDPVVYPTNMALSTLKYSELDNVYLFYLPSYGTTGDKIIYTNNTGEDLTFILVKRQIGSTDGVVIPSGTLYKVDDYATLNSKELTYKCTVTINDPANKTTLRTNVKTNLATLIPDPSNTIGAAGILNDTLASVNLPVGVPKENIAGDKDEDRIFDVTIDIYEPGTIDAALTAGTALPVNKHLATVRGNMN